MLINIEISMADYSEFISCFWILYSIHFVTQLFFYVASKTAFALNPPTDVCNSSNTILLFLKCIAIHKQIRYSFASMIKLEPAGDIQGTSKHSF